MKQNKVKFLWLLTKFVCLSMHNNATVVYPFHCHYCHASRITLWFSFTHWQPQGVSEVSRSQLTIFRLKYFNRAVKSPGYWNSHIREYSKYSRLKPNLTVQEFLWLHHFMHSFALLVLFSIHNVLATQRINTCDLTHW